MMRHACALTLMTAMTWLFAANQLAAVDVIGPEPDWLHDQHSVSAIDMRPVELVAHLQTVTGRSFSVVGDLQEWLAAGGVSLVLTAPRSLETLLGHFELATGLRVAIVHGEIRVGDVNAILEPQRSVALVDLGHYGIAFDRRQASSDISAPSLGLDPDQSRPFDLFGGGTFGHGNANGDGPRIDDVLEWIELALETADQDGFFLDAVGSHHLMLRMAPAERAVTDDRLRDFAETWFAPVHWRVTCAVVEADHLPQRVGVQPVADLAAWHAVMTETLVYDLHGHDGQSLRGGEWQAQSYLHRVHASGADGWAPEMHSIGFGQVVELQGDRGVTGTMLEGRIEWIEPLPARSGLRLRHPSQVVADGSVRMSVVAEAELPESEPDTQEAAGEDAEAATATDDQDEQPTVGGESDDGASAGVMVEADGEVALPAPRVVPGMMIEEPALREWGWRPQLQVFVPEQHGMVLLADHPDGRAVIIIEEVVP